MALQISLGRWFESASPDSFFAPPRPYHLSTNAFLDSYTLTQSNAPWPSNASVDHYLFRTSDTTPLYGAPSQPVPSYR